ncbi:hypothetical protein [Paenibacillus sp. NAIST15-1]|uniref:hypothetical protein n=1 Tax=Paenibacillus sp. NAIST15-1 TaxID=1605994 RepID=UPI00086863B3|nr:hypothetical protein [Paenibacillus sp. NAIST15-1]GAV14767.1 hypothetical protein PBN151_4745 [Paenibacillus sp. NAIST15-1]
MKRVCLLLVLIFALSACNNAVGNTDEKNTPMEVNVKVAKNTENSTITKENALKSSLEFLAEDKNGLSVWDYKTAYEMCEGALSAYYKAIWNGTDINLDAFFDNKSLKQYMQKKVTSQQELFRKNKLTDNLVTDIDVGARKVELVGEDNPYFYFKLDTRVKKDVGSFAEPTEFLVQNLNGRLVITDWYSSGKDSYDSMVRGENQTIDNPDIWNNNEWVKKLEINR